MFSSIKKKLWKLSNEKQDFHAGTNVFANEKLKPSYSRNGTVHIKQNETSRPIIVFYLVKLFSMFPNHFRNNEENDQYHDVSADTNTSCSHHINMIKSAGLNKMLICCHQTLIYQLGLVGFGEVCFAWLYHVLCYGSQVFFSLFLDLNHWIDLFIIFFFARAKMEKNFLELVTIKQDWPDNIRRITL